MFLCVHLLHSMDTSRVGTVPTGRRSTPNVSAVESPVTAFALWKTWDFHLHGSQNDSKIFPKYTGGILGVVLMYFHLLLLENGCSLYSVGCFPDVDNHNPNVDNTSCKSGAMTRDPIQLFQVCISTNAMCRNTAHNWYCYFCLSVPMALSGCFFV